SECSGDRLALHSFPTRRSSDLDDAWLHVGFEEGVSRLPADRLFDRAHHPKTFGGYDVAVGIPDDHLENELLVTVEQLSDALQRLDLGVVGSEAFVAGGDLHPGCERAQRSRSQQGQNDDYEGGALYRGDEPPDDGIHERNS